jgi:hypothetical protein
MNPFSLNRIYENVEYNHDLVFRFFIEFSLFEHALKQIGFVIPRKNDAQPDWSRYSRDINLSIDNHTNNELNEAVNYLLNTPPFKQEFSGGNLNFNYVEADQHLCEHERLSIYIRRVRNNLFHGGKFRYIVPRDDELITNSLVLIEHWAANDPRIQGALRPLVL